MGDDSTQVGQLLAERYRLHELLGEGGMGAVWRATDELLGRVVAVKRVRLTDLPPSEVDIARRRILREARIAAALHHPGAVTVFDVVVVDAEPWLVLEYVPSRSLAAALRDHGTLPADQVGAIGAQLAAALATAHAAGIVHRDVKPDNVLLVEPNREPDTGPTATVKLTDFGISHSSDSPEITGTDVMTGTPAYFAPETARGGGTDRRTDVYSLGATLYEAVEGRPPFGRAEGNVFGLLARIGYGRPAEPSHTGPLADLLRQLTAYEPADRPTAGQAHRALLALTADPADAETVADGARREPDPAGEPLSGARRAALLALALTLTGALIATVVISFSRPAPSIPAPAVPLGALPPIGTVAVTDPRTADPCSLVDPDAMTLAAPARIVEEFGFFRSCWVEIDLGPDGGRGFVEVGFNAPLRPGTTLGGQQEQLGQATVARFTARDGRCQHRLLLSDRTFLQFTGYDTLDPDADVCGLADTVLGSAARVLAADGIGTRVPLDASSAIAGIDTCGLLTPGDLAVVPGFETAEPRAGFGNWSCAWTGSDATTVFVQYIRLDAAGADDGREVPIGDRTGRLESSGENCTARVLQRMFTGNGKERYEMVEVFVRDAADAATACGHAAALAGPVVARLPPPD